LGVNRADFAALAQSKNLHLLAWSMGVWAAAWLARPGHIFSKLSFQSATAIGGTLRPLDDEHGIPEQNFAKMLARLSPAGVEAFYRAMFDQQEQAERFLRCRPQRSCTELREELSCLRELCCSQTEEPPDIYSRRLVTSRDRIFPARSQLRAWGGRKRCLAAALPHFPFYEQEGQELLSRPLTS
jgi:biotin synthesis protein BioG